MCLFCDPATSSRLHYRAAGKTPAERLEGFADVILRGGTILTMDERHPEAEALSVRDGLVQSVGSLDAAMAKKGRSTRIIDLEGRALIPGMVLATLPKDPLDLLGWQHIDLLEAEGDLHAYLAREVAPPLFSEPVFICLRSAGGGEAGGLGLLRAVEALCGPVPVAIRVCGTDEGWANGAMEALAGRSSGVAPAAGANLPRRDIGGLLRPFAQRATHSLSSVARALATTVAAAREQGFTLVVDNSMGSLAGREEVEAAAVLAGGKRQMRIEAVAHRRLRAEWDGRLPPGVRPEMLRVQAALIDAGDEPEEMQAEALSLSRAGWRLVFTPGDAHELEAAVQICARLQRDGVNQPIRHRMEIGFDPDATHLAALAELPVDLSIECGGEAPLHKLGLQSGNGYGPSAVKRRLCAVTRDAARRRGLDHVAGTIMPGRQADFTLLEQLPPASGPIRVAGTWVDGIPVQ
ncbi:MAG: hypothetical protein WA975_01190 [Mesorhizobium sp.]